MLSTHRYTGPTEDERRFMNPGVPDSADGEWTKKTGDTRRAKGGGVLGVRGFGQTNKPPLDYGADGQGENRPDPAKAFRARYSRRQPQNRTAPGADGRSGRNTPPGAGPNETPNDARVRQHKQSAKPEKGTVSVTTNEVGASTKGTEHGENFEGALPGPTEGSPDEESPDPTDGGRETGGGTGMGGTIVALAALAVIVGVAM